MNHFIGKFYFSNSLIINVKQFFRRNNLPPKIVQQVGTVLRLSVWNKNVVTTDVFMGECFIPLKNIEPLRGRASIRDMPVLEEYLEIPLRDNQPQVFEVIIFIDLISFLTSLFIYFSSFKVVQHLIKKQVLFVKNVLLL